MTQMISKFATLILMGKNLLQSKIMYSLFLDCIIKCLAISINMGTAKLRLVNFESFPNNAVTCILFLICEDFLIFLKIEI
jgi:hypothetical protein